MTGTPAHANRDLASYAGVRVLVTGASGFIGRWIARVLTQAGADLVLGVRDATAMRGIAERYSMSGTVAVCDFRKATDIMALVRSTRPHLTFNAVGYGVDSTERDLAEMVAINAEAVVHLADAIEQYADTGWSGVRLVQLGSALEYGTASGRLSEAEEAAPTTSYGRTKLRATLGLAGRRDLRSLTARLFTVYGPGEHAGRLLPTLLEIRPRGTRIPLTEGTQLRDFTYVGDVAEGLVRLGLSHSPAGMVVNLATGHLETVRAFAETAARVLGMPLEALDFGAIQRQRVEMAHDDVTIDRLLAFTGWRPGTSIEAGISATRDFYLEGTALSHGPVRV